LSKHKRVNPASFTGTATSVEITIMAGRDIVDVVVKEKDLDTLRALIDRVRVRNLTKLGLESEIRMLRLMWASELRRAGEMINHEGTEIVKPSKVQATLAVLAMIKNAVGKQQDASKLWKQFKKLEKNMTPGQIAKMQNLARERNLV
jgi:hypothetical protein